MKTYLLLLIAVVLLWILLPVMYLYQMVRHKYNHAKFTYNLAKNIDYVGGTLFFNSDGKTISAMVYEKNLVYGKKVINYMFQDSTHCYKAWLYEFKVKGKLCQNK